MRIKSGKEKVNYQAHLNTQIERKSMKERTTLTDLTISPFSFFKLFCFGLLFFF